MSLQRCRAGLVGAGKIRSYSSGNYGSGLLNTTKIDGMLHLRVKTVCAGIVTGILLIIADQFRGSEAQASIQISVCVLLYGLFCAGMSHTLNRKIPRLIMASLFLVHLVGIFLVRTQFPLGSELTLLSGVSAELMVMVFVYVRLCQGLDPSGPFGMRNTDRERTPKLPKLL